MKIQILEKALTSKQRSSLPDSVFGVPELRAYPMPDKGHVLTAIKMFNRLSDKSYEQELADNIIKMIKKYDMQSEVKVGKDNRFYSYWEKENEA